MHGITKCKTCLDVLLQCRCFNHRQITWVVCDDCRNGVANKNQKFDHELKLWPLYFDDVLTGRKPFEVRIDDRKPRYSVGSVLMFREYKFTEQLYTGREFRKVITYVLPGGTMGLAPEYCVLGLADIPQ